jgi:hypothetical protein
LTLQVGFTRPRPFVPLQIADAGVEEEARRLVPDLAHDLKYFLGFGTQHVLDDDEGAFLTLRDG